MIYLIVTIIVILSIAFILFYSYPSKRMKRMKELIQKKRHFANSVKGKRRFFVGGSDVLYSINTELLNKKDMDAVNVNYGLNVGFGVGFLLDLVKKDLRAGDSVVLCLAYSLYYKPKYDLFAQEYFRVFEPKSLFKIPIRRTIYFILLNLRANWRYTNRALSMAKSGVYTGIKGPHLPKAKQKPLSFPIEFKKTESIEALLEFKNECELKGVSISLTFPSTLYFPVYKENQYLKSLYTFLKKHFEVKGEPQDYFVPLHEISNSVYHVNEKGQKRRTQQVWDQINNI